jgi:hypothetical protein
LALAVLPAILDQDRAEAHPKFPEAVHQEQSDATDAVDAPAILDQDRAEAHPKFPEAVHQEQSDATDDRHQDQGRPNLDRLGRRWTPG